ncbi:ABC transporter permease [Pseudofrankia sp. BMG5.37]|uniref:ABC transporter permease n=1 Tax=Pseudofrankia sp. BMG5.37 TaxID=3050035 RepID=UPI0028961993|nr:ABC transporter permease [Pseudofrankia sp. BMG5.37]MDT3438233.1 ABC transporter permease [Pseudofrankia sp. BMG5.37]
MTTTPRPGIAAATTRRPPRPGPQGGSGPAAGAWQPVGAWLRLDLRRRWLSLVILALLVALAAGTVMAAAAGARRGGSALDRLLAVTLPSDLLPTTNFPGFPWEAARRLPDVAAMGAFRLYDGPAVIIEGHPEVDLTLPADREYFQTVERPVALHGRLANPDRVDEAVVDERFVAATGLTVGDSVTVRFATRASFEVYAGSRDPAALSYSDLRPKLTIVGVGKCFCYGTPDDPGGIVSTYAFTRAHWDDVPDPSPEPMVAAMVRLRDGAAGVPAFQTEINKLAGQPVDAFDAGKLTADYRATTSFEALALAAFALAAFLAAAVLVGQAVVRFVIGAAADLDVMRVLGLTTRQATMAAAAGPVLATVAGVLAGAGGAAAVSPLFPIGAAAWVEPAPGFHLDLVVIGAVAGVTVLLATVVATTTAFTALVSGTRAARPRRSAAARLAYRLGLPVPAVVGTRFALEPGRAGAAVRPALVGAVAGVLGVLGSLTFQAGVADAAANPARFGQTFELVAWTGDQSVDYVQGADYAEFVRTMTSDPDVVAVNNSLVGVAQAAGRSVTLYSLDPLGDRPLSIPPLSGHLPTTAGEIVLAPGAAQRAGVSVGDVVTVAGRDPAAGTPMRVTGLAFVPQDSHTDYDQGGWVTAAGYHTLFEKDFKYHELHLETRPGRAAAVRDRLNAAIGASDAVQLMSDAAPIKAQARFRGIADLPRFLGVFLGLLAVGAVGHALFVGVRRRRHEVAVLRALGTTRWQARAIVLTQAAVIVVVGLVVGLPVGVLLGRALWRAVATSTPLIYAPPVAVLPLALVVPAVIVTAGALASVPARRAARLRVPDVLRAE